MEKQILIVGAGTDFINDMMDELHKLGYECRRLQRMGEALPYVKIDSYSLLILLLDGENCDDILSELPVMRELTLSPIMVLSTVADEATRICALDEGADEYTLFPCTIEESIATGIAQIRRFTVFNTEKDRPVTMVIDHSFILNIGGRKLYINGKIVDLSYFEFEILKVLVENQGRAMPYEEIFRKVWGEEYVDNSKGILWTHINRLREKIQVSPDLPEYITTVKNFGYRFDPQSKCFRDANHT